jgi:hypothetical protein
MMGAAMVKEALAKVLCHNICCLIHSMYELGIVPEFWGQDEPTAVACEPREADEDIEALAWV